MQLTTLFKQTGAKGSITGAELVTKDEAKKYDGTLTPSVHGGVLRKS